MRWPAPLLLVLLTTQIRAQDEDLHGLVEHLKGIDAQIALIEREHADPPARSILWTGASQGIAQSLDRYSRYLSADEVAIYGMGAEVQPWGFGFDWRLDGDPLHLAVTRIVPGSPADAAGLVVGDRILAIGPLMLATASRRQASEALAHSGDQAELLVRRADGNEIRTSLKRVEFLDDGISSVVWVDPQARIARIRVGRFLPARLNAPETATLTGLRTALGRLDGLRGLILDLRGCPGGNLQSAVECAAAWCPEGTVIVEQVARNPARSRPWTADVARLPAVRMALLVDAGTASAAEVLAQALHRHRSVPVVGAQTLGKGAVQQLFMLPGGDALLLTVARLRLPGGAWLDDPLTPDIASQDGDAAVNKALDVVRTLVVAP